MGVLQAVLEDRRTQLSQKMFRTFWERLLITELTKTTSCGPVADDHLDKMPSLDNIVDAAVVTISTHQLNRHVPEEHTFKPFEAIAKKIKAALGTFNECIRKITDFIINTKDKDGMSKLDLLKKKLRELESIFSKQPTVAKPSPDEFGCINTKLDILQGAFDSYSEQVKQQWRVCWGNMKDAMEGYKTVLADFLVRFVETNVYTLGDNGNIELETEKTQVSALAGMFAWVDNLSEDEVKAFNTKYCLGNAVATLPDSDLASMQNSVCANAIGERVKKILSGGVEECVKRRRLANRLDEAERRH